MYNIYGHVFHFHSPTQFPYEVDLFTIDNSTTQIYTEGYENLYIKNL